MKIKRRKLIDWYKWGGKIPRKIKKRTLDRKLRKRELRKRLRENKQGAPIKTMFERPEFTPHGLFCPKCGETGTRCTGNKTSYPEHWENFYCIRCGYQVAMIDNSPFIHALEMPDYILP